MRFVLLLVICMPLIAVGPVLAADTGAKVTTNVVSSGSNWSGFTVANLNNSDNNRASNNTSTDYGVVSNFTFGVPAGAQIDGIKVEVEGRSSNNNKTVNYAVALSGNAGSGWTTAKTDAFTDNVDVTNTMGGINDDWGWTWGDGGFSNANFQLRIYRTGGSFSLQVDLIQVTVYYSVPTFTQASFRGRNDNGNETAATWKAAADTDWTQKVDENFRVRFVVQETAGISSADETFQLEYNRNGGGWNDVTGASSVVRAWASPNVADGADTTQQVGSGTFVTPNAGFDEVNGQAGGTSLDFGGSDEVEVEYCVQIRSVDVANDDTIQLRVKGLDAYSNTPTATVSGIPEFEQDSFRARSDDGSESAATWKASANVDWTQVMDENFRVRFVVQETGDGSAADQSFQLEYNHNGGGWNDVTGASSVVRAWASPNVADGADTTQQVGSGTFVTPNAGFDEVNGLAGGTSLDFSGSDEVEVEYCVQIRSADVSADDTIQLRVKGLDSYTNTPTVTAATSTPPACDQHAFRARNDNGNETTATWKAAADTDWTQKVDENFRVRFVVHEDNGVSEADKTFQLEYNRNGGGWNDVTGASSVVRAWASPNVADGADTTQQVGSGTFITPNAGFDEADGQVGGTALDFAGSDEVELEFSLQIRSADVANGDAIQLRIKDVDTYTSTPTVTVTGILEFVQDSFRGRNNDGSETTATWLAAANVNWTQPVEGDFQPDNFRVRFLVQENGGVSAADKTFQLEYKLNTGSWTDVTGTSTVIKSVGSDYLTDGGDTTQQLGSGTFITPNAGIDESSGQAGGTALDFAGSDEVELEFSLRILGEDVLNNDTIQLRIKGLDTYTNTPTITVEDCTFHRYRKITIQSSQVGADLTDFPVMIKITGTDFQGVEDDVTDADGNDIIFRPSLKGNQLDHELEVYDTTNDIMVAWVKVPSVSSSSNTDIYMYYGNACISSSTQNTAGVWSNGYEAVYHLHDDWNDSTGSHNGTGGQTQGYVSGQIANGVNFEGDSSDYINIGTWSVSGSALTLQAWVQYESLADTRTILDKSSGTSSSNYVWNLSTDKQGSNYRARYYMPGSALNGSTTFSTGTWYMVVGKYDGSASRKYIRIDNAADTDSAQSGSLTENTNQVRIGDHATGGDQPFDGVIDEVRISSVARSNAWLNAEYINHSSPATFFTLGPETPATAVKLLRFEAKGDGDAVNVEWETAHEIGNMGFYLYRSEFPGGPYTRLNDGMIAGSVFGTAGRSYSFLDTAAVRGHLYYYRLEDVDDGGHRTMHGPICVDWDADGLPDDWELAYGLDPTVDDAMLDADSDGLSNLEEYQRGTDPTNPDTDGDGILDGDEVSDRNPEGSYATRSLTAGVEVISEDSTGITLELKTAAFDSRVVAGDGTEFERLSITEYIHGYTQAVGQPELPLKGILVDIPVDQHAELSVLETEAELHEGYRVYPVPQKVGPEEADTGTVGELFAIDEIAYDTDDYYPQYAAELAASFVYRGETKQQLIFYPLAFNPVTGQIHNYTRLRVRIDYVDGNLAKTSGLTPTPWQPPTKAISFDGLPPAGVMASIFGPTPSFVSPLLSALFSFQGLVAAAWAPPDEDVSIAAYKIKVASEGIYEINPTVLTNNGIDPALIDFSRLRLYHLGDEVAIDIYDDNGNDAMDAADTIRFYAPPVAAAYAKYAPDNVFWMTLSGGVDAPLRMAQVEGNPGVGSLAATHTYTHHHELNQTYWVKAPGDDSLDRWVFAAYALGLGFTKSNGDPNPNSGAPVDIDISLSDVGGTMKGTVTMLLYGVYDTDHEVVVSINGGAAGGTLTWSGKTSYQATFEDVDLVDGVNTITITCQSATDSIAFDWFDITYERYFSAASNSLQFEHNDDYRFEVDGFTSDSLVVYDITDAADVLQVTNITTTGAGPYSLSFEPAAAAGDQRTYLALTEANIQTPARIVENTVSDLADTTNGADYILITHRDIGWDGGGSAEAWMTAIVAQREAQGLRVKVVDVEDIFDEFGYGMPTPAAIKDFISYAYENWTAPAPRYVLLVGDAIYDFHDRWGTGKTNHVPAYLTYTKYMGETATDEWYVTVSGNDAVPDLYIGRLPVTTATDAGFMVDKIIVYEDAANSKTWEKDVLLVADDQTEVWETVFETMNNDAAARVPLSMNTPFEGYLRIYEAEGWDLNAELVDAIDAGALMVNYSGHGSYSTWADEQIFTNADAMALNNPNMLPFFVSMSCLTGYFVNTAVWDTPPLVEPLMLSASKGAVAALMPTGMTTTEGQHILNSALFEQVFTEDRRELGEAIANAKMTLLANGDAYYEEISRTFLLFGDPAMQLKVPVPRRVAALSAEADDDYNMALSWQAALDADGAAVDGYHVYRKTAADAGYSRITDQPVTGTDYTDEEVSLGTRYYYVVRSVDADGLESVNSEAVSRVVPVPSANLSGSGGGGGGGCFISTVQEAYSRNIMNGLAFLGLVVLVWQLITRIKARKSGRRRSYLHRGPNSAFDEVTEFELPIGAIQNKPVVAGMEGLANMDPAFSSNQGGDDPVVKEKLSDFALDQPAPTHKEAFDAIAAGKAES